MLTRQVKGYVFKRCRLFIYQRGRCAYCLREMHFEISKPLTATFDHLTPKSKGGKLGYGNIVLACATCNLELGHGPRSPRIPPLQISGKPHQAVFHVNGTPINLGNLIQDMPPELMSLVHTYFQEKTGKEKWEPPA